MIEAVGLTRRHGRVLAVDDVSFRVRAGRVTALLGPRGAGKSTIMRMFLGRERPTAGQALVDGRPYRELDRPLRKIGGLLDTSRIRSRNAARARLGRLARRNGLPARRIDEVLDLVELGDLRAHGSGRLSPRDTRRLGLAGALLGDPEILVLDEPSVGLDPDGVGWLRTLLRRLASEGRTVLVSGHRLSTTSDVADELVVIGRGRLITSCPTEEFLDTAGAATIRVRSPQWMLFARELRRRGLAVAEEIDGEHPALLITGSTSQEIGELAAALSVVVHELSLRRASLDQTFALIADRTSSPSGIEHDAAVAAGDPAVAPHPAAGPRIRAAAAGSRASAGVSDRVRGR
ncbi:ABC-2 type transport system ATP-binding protein [Actinoalloteichus hoggarensis]|uniref:Energy-coupling factor transporter ATP-binding protein EcfA2 n=1 Tax=Actinoalloteichus hoggarensis TaxID=1470176 RepID=A0A221WB86_9PSEU|nr:ATP-binding cassette domain-containing protein [Actinoalloteichus hoggarensis]ASO23054.1 Energy-coupling factor transporter ATP-binding protein EcfA2 [Actinoalloteichus hoggarensis]MBB5922659.1 ABC-2 type transport system ATP-binding protein [Actinoalloteichus hoggarensis]